MLKIAAKMEKIPTLKPYFNMYFYSLVVKTNGFLSHLVILDKVWFTFPVYLSGASSILAFGSKWVNESLCITKQ